MAVETLTFGCRLNAYESEVMKSAAEKAGLDGAIIVNTCAVTAEAVRQAKQAIRKARRDHPDARLIVTGCAAEVERTALAALPEVDAESAEALLMLRVMIAAAKADGTIDAGERQRLAAQLDGAGLSAAARDAILQDFDKPAPALALAKQATDPMLAAQLYAAAVMGAGEISAPERAWLEDFARALKLDRAAITAIEAKLIPV